MIIQGIFFFFVVPIYFVLPMYFTQYCGQKEVNVNIFQMYFIFMLPLRHIKIGYICTNEVFISSFYPRVVNFNTRFNLMFSSFNWLGSENYGWEIKRDGANYILKIVYLFWRPVRQPLYRNSQFQHILKSDELFTSSFRNFLFY